MKNALKFLVAVVVVAVVWYVSIGWRWGTEPISGGWALKAIVAYYQR